MSQSVPSRAWVALPAARRQAEQNPSVGMTLIEAPSALSACVGDAGDSAIRAAFEEIVAPAALSFKPDIVLVGRFSKP